MDDWKDEAACKGLGDWFVMAENLPRRGDAAGRFWTRSRKVCADCSVRRECFVFAITEVPNDDCAMYAGLSPRQRRRVVQRYRRELEGVSCAS